MTAPDPQTSLTSLTTRIGALTAALEGAIVGQSALIRDLVTGVLSGGHVLIEGLPGLGKTWLAKGLARGLDAELSRIQCTPDLMPADVTGSEVLMESERDGRVHGPSPQFMKGPLFAPVVLVDEINRATPRTQSAFLEAMAEGQVTAGGTRHALPQPFWVIATQNPIELEGTYPLPEAQLDRFVFKLNVELPDTRFLADVLAASLDEEPAASIKPVMDPAQAASVMTGAREVVVADAVRDAAIALVLSTHPDRGSAVAERHIRYGASPRGMQALIRSARISALIDGRAHVAMADLARCALPALRHRILLNIDSEMDGVTVDDVLQDLIAASLPE